MADILHNPVYSSGFARRFEIEMVDECLVMRAAYPCSTVPMEAIVAMQKLGPKKAALDFGMQRIYGAIFVTGTEAALKRMRRHPRTLQLKAAIRAGFPPGVTEEMAGWLLDGDVGLSSGAMFKCFTGIDPWRLFPNGRDADQYPHPIDAGDLRRCVDLLDAVPVFKNKLSMLTRLSAVWAGIVENWDELLGRLTADQIHNEAAKRVSGPGGKNIYVDTVREMISRIESGVCGGG